MQHPVPQLRLHLQSGALVKPRAMARRAGRRTAPCAANDAYRITGHAAARLSQAGALSLRRHPCGPTLCAFRLPRLQGSFGLCDENTFRSSNQPTTLFHEIAGDRFRRVAQDTVRGVPFQLGGRFVTARRFVPKQSHHPTGEIASQKTARNDKPGPRDCFANPAQFAGRATGSRSQPSYDDLPPKRTTPSPCVWLTCRADSAIFVNVTSFNKEHSLCHSARICWPS